MTELEKCMAGLPFTCDESTASLARNAKHFIKEFNALDYEDAEGKRRIIGEFFWLHGFSVTFLFS